MDCMYTSETVARSDTGSVISQSPRSISYPPHDIITFDTLDLGLMHHYTMVASTNVFPNGVARKIWQETIPMEAQAHPLLMHGLLSISAMHLACTRNGEIAEYRIRALHHQNAGVAAFSAALSGMTKANAHIMFAFSMMLSVIAFASPQLTGTPTDVAGVLEVFNLIQGNKLVWQLEKATIYASSMAQLLPTVTAADTKLDDEIEDKLVELQRLSDDPSCMEELESLKTCLQVGLAMPDEAPMAARWASTLQERFLFRLKAHKPVALIILAHYSLVVRCYRYTWWLSNWSDILINAVDNALSQESKHIFGWHSKLDFLTSHAMTPR